MSEDEEAIPTTSKGNRQYFPKPKTRKRLCKPETWLKNKRTNAVSRGLDYKSPNTKKDVPARVMKRSCGPGCRYKCENKITSERREEIFNEFRSITDHARKYNFILRHVTENTKNQSPFETSKRRFSRSYSFENQNNENLCICKTMFLNTLDIGERMLRTTFKKFRSGDHVLKDNRGTNEKRP